MTTDLKELRRLLDSGAEKMDAALWAEVKPVLPALLSAAEEAERLRGLVRHAYNEGFGEGMREYSSHRGGKTWMESKSAASLSATASNDGTEGA